jgi:hypothetical protein
MHDERMGKAGFHALTLLPLNYCCYPLTIVCGCICVLWQHASLPRLAKPQHETSVAGQYLSSRRDDWSKPLEVGYIEQLIPAACTITLRLPSSSCPMANTCGSTYSCQLNPPPTRQLHHRDMRKHTGCTSRHLHLVAERPETRSVSINTQLCSMPGTLLMNQNQPFGHGHPLQRYSRRPMSHSIHGSEPVFFFRYPQPHEKLCVTALNIQS